MFSKIAKTIKKKVDIIPCVECGSHEPLNRQALCKTCVQRKIREAGGNIRPCEKCGRQVPINYKLICEDCS